MNGSYIIVGKSSGPARNPAVHATLDQAKAECARLARLAPGDTFTIYRSVMSAQRRDISWEMATPVDVPVSAELDDNIPF